MKTCCDVGGSHENMLAVHMKTCCDVGGSHENILLCGRFLSTRFVHRLPGSNFVQKRALTNYLLCNILFNWVQSGSTNLPDV